MEHLELITRAESLVNEEQNIRDCIIADIMNMRYVMNAGHNSDELDRLLGMPTDLLGVEHEAICHATQSYFRQRAEQRR